MYELLVPSANAPDQKHDRNSISGHGRGSARVLSGWQVVGDRNWHWLGSSGTGPARNSTRRAVCHRLCWSQPLTKPKWGRCRYSPEAAWSSNRNCDRHRVFWSARRRSASPDAGEGNGHFLRKPFKTTAVKEFVDSLSQGPSVRPQQKPSQGSISHLKSVVEPDKLCEELNRVLSQHGIHSVRFVPSDQKIVQESLAYSDHYRNLVTEVRWIEDCSFSDQEIAQQAYHQLILQNALDQVRNSPKQFAYRMFES